MDFYEKSERITALARIHRQLASCIDSGQDLLKTDYNNGVQYGLSLALELVEGEARTILASEVRRQKRLNR